MNIYFSVLEVGKSKIQVLSDLVSIEGPLLVSRMVLLAVSSHGRRGKRVLWGLFYKGTDPFMRTPKALTSK